MSQDLDGEDAFRMVLDKLVDEGHQRVRDIDARQRAESERSTAILELTNLKSELGIAKADLSKYRTADDAFTALYDAVEKAIPRLRMTADDTPFADALRDGIVKAKKFIDPIPF